MILYLSNNPFRVLGLGSSASQGDLRKKSDLALRSASVGLDSDFVGLRETLGPLDPTEVNDIVRNLGSNPVERTIHRIFWPLHYENDSELLRINTGIDFEDLQDAAIYVGCSLATGKVTTANYADVMVKEFDKGITPYLDDIWNAAQGIYQYSMTLSQTDTTSEADLTREKLESLLIDTSQRFAIAQWIRYNETLDPVLAKNALQSFHFLLNSHDFVDALKGCLRNDGEDSGRCEDIVRSAIKHAKETLLNQVIQAVVTRWQAGSPPDGLLLLESAVNAQFSHELDPGTFSAIYALGDAVQTEMSSLDITAQDLLSHKQSWPPVEMLLFQSLIDLIGEISPPQARLWQSEMDSVTRNHAATLRSEAVDLANDHQDYSQANTILDLLSRWDLPQDLADLIEADIVKIREVEAGAQVWKGIKPVSNPPSLYTLNGCGCKLYGYNPFQGRDGWYYSTYYFVIVFIPIFPICQYIVSDAPKSGWYFHASAPLNISHKIHIGVSLLIGLFLFLMFSTPSSTGSTSGTSTSTAATAPATYATSGTDEKQRLDDEYAQLTTELKTLKPTLTEREARLDQQKADIASKRQQLDQEEAQLKVEHDKLDRSSQKSVDTFNSHIEQIKSENKQFNQGIISYNKTLKKLKTDEDAFNAKIDHLHEIDSKLKQIGE